MDFRFFWIIYKGSRMDLFTRAKFSSCSSRLNRNVTQSIIIVAIIILFNEIKDYPGMNDATTSFTKFIHHAGAWRVTVEKLEGICTRLINEIRRQNNNNCSEIRSGCDYMTKRLALFLGTSFILSYDYIIDFISCTRLYKEKSGCESHTLHQEVKHPHPRTMKQDTHFFGPLVLIQIINRNWKELSTVHLDLGLHQSIIVILCIKLWSILLIGNSLS